MAVCGIIAEFDPLHAGHCRLFAEARERLGAGSGIVIAMSGNFTQRGGPAVMDRFARAEAAVRSGADLVLELPLPFALSSAEGFAAGGVRALAATGVCTHLAFGSECGDLARLQALADAACAPDFDAEMRAALKSGGRSYAAAHEAALKALAGPDAELLKCANNALGFSYLKALNKAGIALTPLTLKREGAGHREMDPAADAPSSSLIRTLLAAGDHEQACALMAPAMAEVFAREERAGRAPVRLGDAGERFCLAVLRGMREADFARLDAGGEGLSHRLHAAARACSSVSDFLDRAATRRYPRARIRRLLAWACLGLEPSDLPDGIPYLRLLAASKRGRALLSEMRSRAAVPILSKTADAKSLSIPARALFEKEQRANERYALLFPDLAESLPSRLFAVRPYIEEEAEP